MFLAEMPWKTKLGLGSLLSGVGGLGIVLGPVLGAPTLPRPWGFLAGFLVGILSGLGVSLALAGLIERRSES